MKREKFVRIDLLLESVNVEHVHLLFFLSVSRIAETDLLRQLRRFEKLHRLQMRVELVDYCQPFAQHVFNDVAHGHVVRQTNLLADADKLAAAEIQ